MTACHGCGKAVKPLKNITGRRWCGDSCRRKDWRRRTQRTLFGQRAPVQELTELNHRTTLRYLQCGGQHEESGEYVLRDFDGEPHRLPVCARCGVPFRVPKSTWLGSYRTGKRGKRKDAA